MKVSVVMATYNGTSYLQEQLESFVSQKLTPDELIIVDDRSTDGTVSLIAEFSKDAPFKVSYTVNDITLGYSLNFNKALSFSTGDIVLLSDQDDFWLPEKIQTVCDVFVDNPAAALVIHDLAFCDQSLRQMGHTKIERLSKFTNVKKYHVTGMATAVRREFLNLCLPIPNEFLSHDTWLHLCAYYAGVKVVIPDVLALYRRHEDNATASQFVNKPSNMNWLQLFISKFKSINLDTIQLSLFRHRAVKKWLEDNERNLTLELGVKRKKIFLSKISLKFKVLFLIFSVKFTQTCKALF